MSSSISGQDDLTRKQRREQARAERRAAEQAALARDRQRRRLYQLGAALLVAVVVIAVAVVVSSSGGSKKKGLVTGAAGNATVSAVSSVLAGLPQSGNTLGNPKAPVTIQYYGDLECPVCQQFTLQSLPGILGAEVRTGKAQLQYHSLETATQSPSTFQTQQTAALAAGQQQKAWDYIELFYHEQGAEDTGYVSEAYLQGLAQQVPGLNLTAWESARGNPTITHQVTSDEQTASARGFNSTPTIVVTGPKGAKYVAGDVPASTVESMVQAVSS